MKNFGERSLGMTNNITRILTETVVKNTLKEIEDSPERSIRKLVDMALNFSEGRFRTDFFTIARGMLENEDSPYYDLIRDVLTHVDHERILRFGMNLGFNSCTEGAKRIRRNEETMGFNIPWCVFLHLDQKRILENPGQYSRVFSQGEDLGIYTWILEADGPLAEILPLMKEHGDSAFVLVCGPESVTEDFLDSASQVSHMMPAVLYDEERAEVFDLLRERKLLYAACQFYGDQDAEDILNGDLFYSAEQTHAALTALLPAKECTAVTRTRVAKYVERARNEQLFRTIPWEAWYDNCRVDAIISGDACFVDFDAQGDLYGLRSCPGEASLNVFRNDLAQILR
ncbi:MAG: hypothetical protein LUE87_04925, partial [Lachnospiraceae bacterium]|nr:hypothetical protein [Lachnospiraceae bacterium]